MKGDTVIFGNIITMKDAASRAEALVVRDGKIILVGDRKDALEYLDEETEIFDYDNNYVYPGMIESHCHPVAAGLVLSMLQLGDCKTKEETLAAIRKEVESHPEQDQYKAFGWKMDVCPGDRKLLDEISDKPMLISSGCGHFGWMNTAAMKLVGIDRSWVEKYGEDMVKVDENGEPTGVVGESAKTDASAKWPETIQSLEKSILAWQTLACSKGITATCEAFINLAGPRAIEAYHNIAERGDLTLPTFAMFEIKENEPDIQKSVEQLAAYRDQYATGAFHLNTVKVFLDGVVECRTAWLLDDYLDQPGYQGVKRFTDADKFAAMTKRAQELGLNIHCHSIGNGATKFMCDALEKLDRDTVRSMRNGAAHLELIRPEDIQRMADMNITAVTPPLWVAKNNYPSFEDEAKLTGRELAEKAYPIKSFLNAGANVTFHSDFPVSQQFDIPETIYDAITRNAYGNEGDEFVRGIEEALSPYEALCALTKNAAYAFGVENEMGTLEEGKAANMVVFDTDFLNCRTSHIPEATLMATIVDGREVYTSREEDMRVALYNKLLPVVGDILKSVFGNDLLLTDLNS